VYYCVILLWTHASAPYGGPEIHHGPLVWAIQEDGVSAILYPGSLPTAECRPWSSGGVQNKTALKDITGEVKMHLQAMGPI